MGIQNANAPEEEKLVKNRAFYMTELKKLEMNEIDMPVAKEGEVVVKLEYVGICGSDVHYLEYGRIGDFVVDGDFILGHECAGEVVELGPGVKHLEGRGPGCAGAWSHLRPV